MRGGPSTLLAVAAYAAQHSRPVPWAYAHGYLLPPHSRLTGTPELAPGIDSFFTINMDAQDAQDNQDGTLLHEKPAPAMIVCGIADTQDCKLAVS